MTGGNVARGRTAIGSGGLRGLPYDSGIDNGGPTVGSTLERIASRPQLGRQVPVTRF